MTNCLLLVDVQNGFISPRTEYIIPKIKELVKSNKFDYILSTQFINLENGPYVHNMNWRRLMTSPEIDVLDFVKSNSDLIIKKNIYSALVPEFNHFIHEKDIDTFYLAGIDTDCCVLKTAVDMFEKDMNFKVLIDYTASNGGIESYNAALTVMRRMIGKRNLISGLPE